MDKGWPLFWDGNPLLYHSLLKAEMLSVVWGGWVKANALMLYFWLKTSWNSKMIFSHECESAVRVNWKSW